MQPEAATRNPLDKEEVAMKRCVRWFGFITFLIVALAVSSPAWARKVHTENGNGICDAGELPTCNPVAPFPGNVTYTFVGDANGNMNLTLGPAPFTPWTNPGSICLTTQFTSLTGGTYPSPPLPLLLPLPAALSVVESPVFNLNFGNSAPSIIKVSFNARFSTNQPTSPPNQATATYPAVTRSMDQATVRLITSAGNYPLFMVDPNGPQPTSSTITQTKVSGWTGTWFTPGDTAGTTAYISGTPTLVVNTTIYPGGADAGRIRTDGRAKLHFAINSDGLAAIGIPSVLCVENISVDVTP